jgi:magnesium-transporting ATPase (P-type)
MPVVNEQAPVMKRTISLYPTSWTRRLQHAVLYFAVAMIIGSILVGFRFENTTEMTGVFQRTGLSAAAATQAASTFLVWYRLVAVLFCLLYALGAYGSWCGETWAFWYVILVFGVLGAGGVIFVPLQDTSLQGWGLVVSELTDGSSFLIGAMLFGAYVRYRTPWAQVRTTYGGRAIHA